MARRSYPPGPSSALPLGTLFQFAKMPTDFLAKAARDFGDVSHFQFGWAHFYLLNHPDLIKEVLISRSTELLKGRGVARARKMFGNGLFTAEGQDHKRQRRLSQPAFHKDRIANYAAVMSAFSRRQASQWQDGQEIDVVKEMMRLTLSIVGKCLFDADIEKGEADTIRESLNDAIELFARITNPASVLLDRLPLPSNRRFYQARARIDGVIFGMIEERKRGGQDKGDLLSMLIQAEDSEDERRRLSPDEVRDEAVTILLAGHETVAYTLCYVWALLAKNPGVYDQVQEEVGREIGDREPGLEDLPKLKLCRQVLEESLRVYPTGWITPRRCKQDLQLAGYQLKKGDTILLSQWVTHRDPRWFAEPERFDPGRWTEEAKAERPDFSYFPFGAGPRACIGESFAWMEATLVIASLAQRWRMEWPEGQPFGLDPQITLRPRYPLKMRLKARQKQALERGPKTH